MRGEAAGDLIVFIRRKPADDRRLKKAEGEQVPTKYWLSTFVQDLTLARLVELAKLRWRIERDKQELKQEVVSVASRDVGGVAFIITPHCASDGILISDRETDSPFAPRAAARFQPRPQAQVGLLRLRHLTG